MPVHGLIYGSVASYQSLATRLVDIAKLNKSKPGTNKIILIFQFILDKICNLDNILYTSLQKVTDQKINTKRYSR